MKFKILVCCHKEAVCSDKEEYLPIHVGKALSDKDLHIQADNSGDNISNKNGSFCELTGMYWAWKNLKEVDYIGLCHYRRFFDFHRQCKSMLPVTQFLSSEFPKLDLSIPPKIKKLLEKGFVIAPSEKNYRCSLHVDYCVAHMSEDIRVLEQVVNELSCDDIKSAYKYVMHENHKLMNFNMFIMSWAQFDDYCQWLFKVLFEVERRVDISKYDSVQKRIFGYMSERLFNVYLRAKHLKVKQYPIIWINDNPSMIYTSRVRYFLRCKMNELAFRLNCNLT